MLSEVSPLMQFEKNRSLILEKVVQKTQEDGFRESLELTLGEALYMEAQRLKNRSHFERLNPFMFFKHQEDHKIWNKVRQSLLLPGGEGDQKALVLEVIRHYAEEVGGHFDPCIYKIAVKMVPWGLSWLLNAVSFKQFSPWNIKESLRSRIQILGEVELLQKLTKKGTVLLVPTHQSNIDSVLIGYVIYLMSLPPFAYGAGFNLFANPILSFFMSRLGAYTVDRRKKNFIYKRTLKNYSTSILKEGIHSIFFPGGGRSRSGAIESKLKLGLLGTAIQAQIENHLRKKESPKIFIVPMVTSYHFVLEASSLIETYLANIGKERYLLLKDESWKITKVIGFFFKLFSSQSEINIRIGRPLDVFGNFVDEQGFSLGPNGVFIEPIKWLTTHGQLRPEVQRDEEYTRELGRQLVNRFHKENTVLSSHLVAFSFLETLKKKYSELDLFRLLRLSLSQRSIPLSLFMEVAEKQYAKLLRLSQQGGLFIAEDLKVSQTQKWVSEGVRQLGLFHGAKVVQIAEDAIWTEDMNLLYYYSNRLSGYSLSDFEKG